MIKPVVLASSSPRRRELLEKTGLKFTVDSSETDERLDSTSGPVELARSISSMKATSAVPRHPGSIIIAADTFGVLDGKLLGKPDDAPHAREMLKVMSGKCHEVITGFTIIDTDSGKTISHVVKTRVYFKALSKAQIEEYVETGEPLGKAGAYAIQGKGADLVAKIEGDYYNVIGLPVHALAKELKKFGIDLPNASHFDRAADSPAR
jgi:septum formation protein